MKILSCRELLKYVCSQTGKYGLYISFDPDEDIFEIMKAAPYIKLDAFEIRLNGEGTFLFDSKEEMMNCFNQTVGDDGPTEFNPYDGPARVYACTYHPNGDGMENS
jgi:hypothetical protein